MTKQETTVMLCHENNYLLNFFTVIEHETANKVEHLHA